LLIKFYSVPDGEALGVTDNLGVRVELTVATGEGISPLGLAVCSVGDIVSDGEKAGALATAPRSLRVFITVVSRRGDSGSIARIKEDGTVEVTHAWYESAAIQTTTVNKVHIAMTRRSLLFIIKCL